MQTHLALRVLKGSLKPDKDVHVLFATQPDRKAVLFIHGYSGDAVETWANFHELLPGCTKCSSRDIYFYGYDGLRADMFASASTFRIFLDRFFNATDALLAANLPPSAKRQSNFEYDELIVVAHSLGAVISRRALLDATKSNSKWVTRTKLILYAPAHCGAKVYDLALEVASSFPFLGLFGIATRFHSPLIDELKSGSQSLTDLLEETMVATKRGANKHLVATKVVIAEYEKIVQNRTFGRDPPPLAIPESTHTSICKPRSDFLRPLDILESCL
jgi:pimeloyl-ACP methyl ester carboxylesterase